MTLNELDSLLVDAQKQPHVADRIEQYMAIALIEIARQLTILNQTLAASGDKPKPNTKAAKSGK